MELDFSKNIKDSAELQQILADQKSRKEINDLPDSAFAYIEQGGRKVEGKTIPHSLRHFPVYNEASIQRSLTAVGKSTLCTESKAQVYATIEAKASILGVKVDEGMALAAERYDGKTRSELEDSAFLDPKRRSFPVVSCKNVRAAVSTWGMYKGPMSFDEFKRKLTARAKKLGCESSLPKSWKDESSAKDWEKTDEKELKRDDKKEKKEHHKDAVKDDESKLKKLKKDKPSEKKSVETHDLKKDIKYDKKKESQGGLPPWLEKKKKGDDKKSDDKKSDDKKSDDKKGDEKKESEAATDKQKAARDAFMEMIKKKKGGDKDDKKSEDKDDKKSDDKKSDDKKDEKKESKAADEDRDKKELDRDDKKEKAEHERDAIKDDKDQVDHLKEDEREDKKALKEDDAMVKMQSRIKELDRARNDMEVEKTMTQKKLDAMMQKMRASDAP